MFSSIRLISRRRFANGVLGSVSKRANKIPIKTILRADNPRKMVLIVVTARYLGRLLYN
ncbi:hypothetical protein [Bartonella sp. DB5-6]|uniref:hypothetical protein n=1 Tax=Bartonella sp. DB5-6 TaxID=1094755 RepID=UPI00031B5180|nr:hypothetical protein [Bartonella sp. DB5-6]